jgi:hypothetical protein
MPITIYLPRDDFGDDPPPRFSATDLPPGLAINPDTAVGRGALVLSAQAPGTQGDAS